jgi:Flp pilus assembly pilin Flp
MPVASACKGPRSASQVVADVSGVATVEYVILLMLIAVVSIGAWASLGRAIKAEIECTADAIEDDEVHCSGSAKQNGGALSDPTTAGPVSNSSGSVPVPKPKE